MDVRIYYNIFSLMESEMRLEWFIIDPQRVSFFGKYSPKNYYWLNYVLIFAFTPALFMLRILSTICPQWCSFILKILHQQ